MKPRMKPPMPNVGPRKFVKESDKCIRPNKNIFTENSYELKKDMTFQEKYELNCQKIFFVRGIKILKAFNFYMFISNLINLFRFDEYGIYCFIRIPGILINILLFLLLNNYKKIVNNGNALRMVFLILGILNIFTFCKSIPDEDDPVKNPNQINYFFTLTVFYNGYFFAITLNFIFALGYSKSLLYIIIDNIALLACYGHQKEFIIKRIILNIFSFRFLISLFYIIISLVIQGIFNKPSKKLWAMYDSFKGSYITFKSIFDNVSLPLFVVDKNLVRIHYKNPAAISFLKQYRRELGNETGIIKFKDIFHLKTPEEEKLFREELEYSLKTRAGFFFPFLLGNHNNNLGINLCNLKIDENTEFIKIYCYECSWKEKPNHYFFLLKGNLFAFQGGRVLLNNFVKIKDELEKIIWNINTVCLNINENNNINEEIDSPMAKLNWTSFLSPRVLKINFDKNNIAKHFDKKDEKQKQNYTKLNMYSINSSDEDDNNNKTNNGESKLLKEKIKAEELKKKSQQLNPSIDRDMLIFFYLNLSSNYVNDLIINNYLYNSFIERKTLKSLKRLNFNNLLTYMVDYMTPFAIHKNVKIKIIDYIREKEVVCNYIYIRSIIFNILMFIIQNTNYKQEKTILINPEHYHFGNQNDGGNFYKLTFSFTDANPKLKYETLNKFFKHFNYQFFLHKDPEDLEKVINFNILLPSIISETQYNLKQIEDSDLLPRQFQIETSGENVNISIFIYLQKEPKNIEYKDFLLIGKCETVMNIKTVLAEVFNEKKPFIEEPEPPFDNGGDDDFLKNTEEYTFENDKKIVHDLRVIKSVDPHKLRKTNFESKLKFINSKKFKLKKYTKMKISYTNVNNPNTENYRIVKYFLTDFSNDDLPRIIILEEDKNTNTKSLFNVILNSKFTCNIDIAADGYDLYEKYRHLYIYKKLFDYMFVEYENIHLKGYEAVKFIREKEKETKKKETYTKIIGIKDKRNNIKNNNIYDLKKFDKIIERPFDENTVNEIFFTSRFIEIDKTGE